MKYAWIRQHRDLFSVTAQCEALEVSTSGYYAWVDRPESPRAVRHARIQQAVREVHADSHGIYGTDLGAKHSHSSGYGEHCNDERASFGVMSGHERKTLRLSASSRLALTNAARRSRAPDAHQPIKPQLARGPPGRSVGAQGPRRGPLVAPGAGAIATGG